MAEPLRLIHSEPHHDVSDGQRMNDFGRPDGGERRQSRFRLPDDFPDEYPENDYLGIYTPLPRDEDMPWELQDEHPRLALVPSLETGTPRESEPETTTRAANPADIRDLVRIELAAFKDVYGTDPSTEVQQAVRQKFEARLSILGDWVRVIEHPSVGVFGMLVGARTNLDKAALLERDMTDTSDIEAAHDPDGVNGYVINLAVLPNDGLGNRFDLFNDAIGRGIEAGIENVYFESRLPGLNRWVKQQVSRNRVNEPSSEELDAYAEQYWRASRDIAGKAQPVDKLLRLYTEIGAEPLCLVKDAWQIDKPSRAYGVLCELKLPKADTHEPEQTIPEAIDPADTTVALGFLRRTLNTIRNNKKKVVVGSAVGFSAYEVATSPIGAIIHEVGQNLPWAGPAYLASMATYLGSGSLMLAGAGAAVRNPFKFRENAELIGARFRESRLIRACFWPNRLSALGAAGVASAAIVETLPPGSWASLALIAGDVGTTYVIGQTVHSHIKPRASRPTETD